MTTGWDESGCIEASGHRLEWARLEGTGPDGPAVVLLHEGLGCVALWRDFPQRLRAATGLPVVAYSRYGYGGSDVLQAPHAADFMHREAVDVLPQVLARLGVERPLLVGHSDGASIALIHAGRYPQAQAGVVAMAPHLFVEPICVDAISAVARGFAGSDLPARLGRYHRDAARTFHGWADVWLSQPFRAWNIEPEVASIECPVLAIQGEDDEYGTMRQIERIAELQPGARLARLGRCRHSPHLDRPDDVVAAIAGFAGGIGTRPPGAGQPVQVPR